MGGNNSQHFLKFKELCCKSFNIFRRFSNYILLLMNLMINAEIPHLSGEYSLNIHKVIEKNLRLDLTDDEANDFMVDLIHSSLKKIVPKITGFFFFFNF
jgi:phosphatidylinositol 3-kinase